MKKETWVVVANSSQARIFKLEKLALQEIETFIHPQSRLHEGDLVADKYGTTNPSIGISRDSMDQQTSAKKVEAINFAKQVSDFMESARTSDKIERFFVAASPAFLGLLRQELHQATASLIAEEVAKDITHMQPKEIITYFPIGL